MAYSGAQGKIVITAPAAKTPPVGSYTLNKRAKLSESTHSGSGGGEERTKVNRGGTVSFMCNYDATDTPEAIGMAEGDEFTANLWIGESGKMYSPVTLIVENIDIVGVSQDSHVTYSGTAYVQGALGDPVAAA